MGHKDSPRSAMPHTLSGLHHWGASAASDSAGNCPGDGETLALAAGADHNEAAGGPWWAAWIDLGGEG